MHLSTLIIYSAVLFAHAAVDNDQPSEFIHECVDQSIVGPVGRNDVWVFFITYNKSACFINNLKTSRRLTPDGVTKTSATQLIRPTDQIPYLKRGWSKTMAISSYFLTLLAGCKLLVLLIWSKYY